VPTSSKWRKVRNECRVGHIQALDISQVCLYCWLSTRCIKRKSNYSVLSLQETWIQQFLVSRLHPPLATTDAAKQKVHAISEVQRDVGGAIQDCVTKYRKKIDPGNHKEQPILRPLHVARSFGFWNKCDFSTRRRYLTTTLLRSNTWIRSRSITKFPWALYMMKLIREKFSSSSLQEHGNDSSIERAMAPVQKDELVRQPFHSGLRQLPGCANIDIQADLESELHETLLQKVFHARINESIKQYKATAMGKNGQKGVTGLDFRAG
jgi:hypothetical protein